MAVANHKENKLVCQPLIKRRGEKETKPVTVIIYGGKWELIWESLPEWETANTSSFPL